jgi:hypothetical protein
VKDLRRKGGTNSVVTEKQNNDDQKLILRGNAISVNRKAY